MIRLLLLVTVILSVASLASAQVVAQLNTVLGPVTQGAKVQVSWTLVDGVDATGKFGDLSATDAATKNVIEIDPKVPLAPKTYLWEIKVPAGTYYLGLNDGAGPKQSGEVVVKAADGAAPAPAPAPGPAPGPAPAPAPAPAAPAPAPAPATPKDNTPAKDATPPKDAPAAAPSAPAASPSTISKSGASLVFPGYEVVFSLLSIAIAMAQF